METTKIYLPLFGGFYESIHWIDYENIIDDFIESVENDYGHYKISDKDAEMIKKDEWEAWDIFEKYYEIDYDKYRDDYSKEYSEVFKASFDYLLDELGVKEFSFIGLYSPSFYNYGSDEIEMSINYDFDTMLSYIKKHKDLFEKYIKEKNTSYDWFMAYGTNDINQYLWKESFEAFEITQIIDFAVTWIDDPDNENIVFELHETTAESVDGYNYIN